MTTAAPGAEDRPPTETAAAVVAETDGDPASPIAARATDGGGSLDIPTGNQEGTDGQVSRQLGKWAIFTAGLAVFPAGIDAVLQLNFHRIITLQYLFPAPTTYLVGVGVVAGGLGELLFARRRRDRELRGAAEIVCMTLTMFLLVIGGVLYSANKLVPATEFTLPIVYLVSAVVASGLSVYVAWRS